MKQPKISIIVPVYNVEPYIAECMQSVMRQTYQGPIECIVVDDCGTDQSIEIADQLIVEYDGPIEFRVLHHEHNRGLSAARNTGVEQATGEYLYFLDSDDYISYDCLDVLSGPLSEQDYEMVVGDLIIVDGPCDIPFMLNETREVVGREKIFNELCCVETTYMMAWNKLLKASLFHKYDLSFLEGQIHEDELWTYKVASCLTSMFVLRVPTYFYRIRENSITSNTNAASLLARMKSRYYTIDYVLDHPVSVEKDCYNRYLVRRFELYVRQSFLVTAGFRKDFVTLRRKFDYHPRLRVIGGTLSFSESKGQLYLFLPPILGYFLLKVRALWKHCKQG